VDAVELAYAGVARQAELVRAGEVSSRELVELALGRIERLNLRLGAFTAVDGERALAAADACDAARAAGDERPLLGVPVALKQDCDVEGFVTTFGGAANVSAARADGALVRRLRDAGAVIVGKTAMPEFGQFPFTESAAWGYARNPWDPTRTPGGSSGGTAVAVAAGLVAGGYGSDGGGSVRIPAACCGVFGLKPQRGRITPAPAEALWEALGVFGPIARRVVDAALLADAVRGSAVSDRYRAREPSMSFLEAASAPPGRLRIAIVLRSPLRAIRLAGEHAAAVHETAEVLRELGHDVREIELAYPDTTLAFGPQFYGGVRDEARGVEHPDLLERRTKQTLAIARLFPRPLVRAAVTHGERLSARLNRIFATHDVLLTPAMAARPRAIGALDGLDTLRASVRALPAIAYAAVWNVCGNPAASVPAGIAADGLPLAVQLVGRPHDEPTIIALARQLEEARPWADRRPPLD
jgi:amidase